VATDVALAHAVATAPIDPPPPSPASAPELRAAPHVGVQPAWSADESGDIRGVLIQVAGGRLLLPNATIAEVLSYAEPEPDASGADWLLGRMRWRGWQLPLVAFSRLAGIGEDKPGLGSKVIVLKALGGDRRLPFFAVVTQGFPRLVTVSRTALSVESGDAPLPRGVQAFVRLNDEPALLPDLLQVEQQLHELRDAA
jgi:chemosensory pili system protein ChpC